MNNLLIACLGLCILTGCSSPRFYKGVTTNCAGSPLAGIEIQAWKNQWIPGYLPISLGTTTSNAEGQFTLSVSQQASFFTYGSNQLIVSQPTKITHSKCNE